CKRLDTSASRTAVGGTVPGLARACCRTKARAVETAALAIPSHTLDQRTCDTGTMVWLAISAKGAGSTCSSGPCAKTLNEGLHVPRIPIVSQLPVFSTR